MVVRLPTVIKDPRTSRLLNLKQPVEQFEADDRELFLDGPVGRRVAVLDFDPKTGALSAPVPFRPPNNRKKIGGYEVKDLNDVRAPDLMKVSVFATVLKTMKLFEGKDTLGRRLTWAFNAPQLLVVPRAGEWRNAYYERDSHSLQFFWFPSAGEPPQIVYTALSHDIVSHETGHAILDGVAPDLYNAIAPQSLAMHEAVADLTALMMAFKSPKLSRAVLEANQGAIDDSSVFSGIAPEFASERDPGGRQLYLRNLNNDKTLDPNGRPEDVVARHEPHALSEVLSGALYSVMLKTYKAVWAQQAQANPNKPPVALAGRALFIAAERIKRMTFRALDYLPPGEASFADYGRSILASDQASYPNDDQERKWIAEEFARRQIVAGARELEVRTDCEEGALKGIDLQTLVDSDWAAYEFANRNRELLGIPPGKPFRVRPRLDVTKFYYYRKAALGEDDQLGVRECLFKVSWDAEEDNPLGGPLPRKRLVTVGTTLAIDWKTRRVRALLTSDRAPAQQADRDEMLRRLLDQGVLRFADEAIGPDGQPRPDVICAEALDGVMRLRGTARMLHILGDLS